jgi:tRNA-dihydrouridine synthase
MRKPASLAPMEGVTSFPTRLWLHLASAPAAMTTPFLRVTRAPLPDGRLPQGYAPELFELRGALPYQLMPQLLAAEADAFLRAAEWLPPAVTPAIELNCGCPAPTSAGRGAGSGLLQDPRELGDLLGHLSARIGAGRLAVKIRLGFDGRGEWPGLLPHVAAVPLARLTVHGRSRVDGYRGFADWAAVEAAAHAVTAPTWGSGDVCGLQGFAERVAQAPSAAGVVVGRGALRNPWVFAELSTGEEQTLDGPTLAHAVLCFALLHDVWLRAPHKLLSRVASGRIGAPCRAVGDAWEGLAAALTSLAFGAPQVLSPRREVPALAVSPTVVARVRQLWTHLRTSLPPELITQRLARARRLDDLLGGLLALGAATLRHRPESDLLFGGASTPTVASTVSDAG